MKKTISLLFVILAVIGMKAVESNDIKAAGSPVEITAITGPGTLPVNSMFTYWPEPANELFAKGGTVKWGVSHSSSQIELISVDQGRRAYVTVKDPSITNFAIYCWHVTADGQEGWKFERQIFIGDNVIYDGE